MSEHDLPFKVPLKCSRCCLKIEELPGSYYFTSSNGIIMCKTCYISNTLDLLVPLHEIPVSRFEFEALKQEIEKLKEEVENLKNVRP